MQDHEMRGLLGDAYADTTPEQRDRIDRAATAIDTRWPDPDLADTRQTALNGAMALILGADTLEDVGQRMNAARAAYQEALVELTGALIASAGRAWQHRDGHGEGHIHDGSDADLARTAGITRATVRKALGK